MAPATLCPYGTPTSDVGPEKSANCPIGTGTSSARAEMGAASAPTRNSLQMNIMRSPCVCRGFRTTPAPGQAIGREAKEQDDRGPDRHFAQVGKAVVQVEPSVDPAPAERGRRGAH